MTVSTPWRITPVLGLHLSHTAVWRFNYAHASMKSVVEHYIGLLKNRFRCLQRYRTLHYQPAAATQIIAACAVLHNICVEAKELDFESSSDDTSGESSDESDDTVQQRCPAGSVGSGSVQESLLEKGKPLRASCIKQFEMPQQNWQVQRLRRLRCQLHHSRRN